MKLMKILLGLCLLYCVNIAAAVESWSDYRLASGDKIKILVYEEPDLSMELRLSDAGTISYPFLGEIRVLGLSASGLEKRIHDGLKGDYLVKPEVSVSVLEYRPFFIHGEVESPGGFAFVPGITLRKAIALAGGFTERASRRKIVVIRDLEGARTLTLDEEVKPGDIITVEQSFF